MENQNNIVDQIDELNIDQQAALAKLMAEIEEDAAFQSHSSATCDAS